MYVCIYTYSLSMLLKLMYTLNMIQDVVIRCDVCFPTTSPGRVFVSATLAAVGLLLLRLGDKRYQDTRWMPE